jgi:hypothetical protein
MTIDDRITDAAQRRAIETVAVPDPVDFVRSRRRRQNIGRALVGATALLAVALGVGDRIGDENNDVTVIDAPTTGPTAPTTSTTSTAPATGQANIDPRIFAVSAWTGEQYLVWSGEAGSEDNIPAGGWALDPRTGEATEIPPAPIGGDGGGAGVWTGSELIVCCGRGSTTYRAADPPASGAAAAYDPARRRWRALADPPPELTTPAAPLASLYLAAVWTGDEMLVVSGDDGVDTVVAAYTPASDMWRLIEGAPFGVGRQPEIAWTGDELVVWVRSVDGSGSARYNPDSNSWQQLPLLPADADIYLASIVWTGQELIVWGVDGYSWQAGTDHWAQLPDPGLPPIESYEGTPGSQAIAWDATRGTAILWPAHGHEIFDDEGLGLNALMAFDPATRSWERLGDAALGYHPDLTSGEGWLMWPSAPNPTILEPPG